VEAKKIEIKTFCLSFAALVLVETATIFLIAWTNISPMAIIGAVRLIETALIIMIVILWGHGLASIGLAPSKMFKGLIRGLYWSAGFGIITCFAFIALFLVDVDPLALIHTSLPAQAGEIVIFFLVAGIMGPVAEEVFFRGIIYGFFRRWGVLAALVISSVIFVLAHATLSGIPVPQIVGGVLFAIAYEKEGNLTVPITIHVLGNMAIFTFSLIY